MSRSEEKKPGNSTDGVRAVEAFWQAKLPETFGRLYAQPDPPFLAPCEFFTLDAIARGSGRSFGLLPQYLPFGRAVGEGGLYGFYATPQTGVEAWPILYWDEDEMYLRPVASNFTAFLRHCALVGRYETEEHWESQDPAGQEALAWRELGKRLELPEDILFGLVPRNDTELRERMVTYDPQDAVSLCHLGCVQRARGDSERALDFFHRASEAAPWFGDPSYLVADIHRERGNYARATQGWWTVTQCLLPLCTRTWDWDLGEDHPEADIYEVAADGLAQHEEDMEAALRRDPLWRVVVQEDPYDPDAREGLGDTLLARNDLAGAEREYLNALSLCCIERGKQPERLYNALISLYERTGRTRDAALAHYDRKLPRPTL